MNINENTKKLVMTALFTALIFIGTIIIRIPSLTGGYIHPGDGFVLLSGLLIGPLWGALASGLGCALADILGGYIIYAPATFIIKALTALICAVTYKITANLYIQKHHTKKMEIINLLLSGIFGEAIMILGYFIYEIFLIAFSQGGSINKITLEAGLTASLTGIIPNVFQGILGIAISTVLFPLLKKLSLAH